MEDFIVNLSLSEFEEFSKVNPAQLAVGSGSVVAQPQIRSQHPILAILQELRVNMQSMDERVNELSTKVNQTQSGNSTKVQNISSDLTQNNTLCEVQSTISSTPLACNATTETESETP